MTLLNKFATYIGTRTGRTSAVIVALAGAILAIFICLTFVDPAAPTYRIDFKDARWIQMPEATKWDAAYFRKTLYVSGSVVRGWIAISATGNYSIFVNGILVAQDEFPAVRPTGIIDIKKILSPGKNVIGVYVAPGSYPGPPQILVHGNYQVASSPATEIDSDSSWKVAATPDGVVQSYSWRSPELDDRLWTDAVEASSGERFSTVQPIPVEPRIFDSPSNAKWITARHGDRRRISFSSTLDIPRGLTRTWIQIAASGAYDVVINGRLAVSQPLAAQATVGTTMPSASAASRVTVGAATVPATTIPGVGPTGATPAAILRQEILDENHTDAVTSANSVLPGSGTPAAINDMATRGIIEGPDLLSAQDIAKASAAPYEGSAGEFSDTFDITSAEASPSAQPKSFPLFLGVTNAAPVLLAYDISQWLKGGINSIAISVRSVNGPALLLAQGFTVSGGHLVASFRTDGSWKVCSYSEAARARFGAQEPAAIGGAEEDSPWGPLPQAMAYPQNPPGQD